MTVASERISPAARESGASVAGSERTTRTRAVPARLGGLSLSRGAVLLAASGTVGGLLFTVTYIAEGATRAGYDPWGQAISALSLGPGGWVQRVNFAVFGVLMAISAVGWRRVLNPGRGALAFPVLRAVAGLGLLTCGLFSQDPAPGYPPGVAATAHTAHGMIHSMAAFVAIMALAGSCLVLARRFAAAPAWRGWSWYAVLTGILTIVFIAVFGAMGAHGGMSGLFERLAGGVDSLLGIAVITRLLTARLRGASPPAG